MVGVKKRPASPAPVRVTTVAAVVAMVEVRGIWARPRVKSIEGNRSVATRREDEVSDRRAGQGDDATGRLIDNRPFSDAIGPGARRSRWRFPIRIAAAPLTLSDPAAADRDLHGLRTETGLVDDEKGASPVGNEAVAGKVTVRGAVNDVIAMLRSVCRTT